MDDYDLKLTMTKLRQKRMNFAFYRGDKDNQVLITSKPAAPKAVQKLEKECGAVKRVFKGVVFQEGEQLVFATKDAPSPQWETQLTKVFKERKCAQFLPLIVRQLAADESDEVELEAGESEAESEGASGSTDIESSVPTPPVTPPPDPAQQTWLKLKAALTPRIAPALAADPSKKSQIQGAVQTALTHEKAGEFAAAVETFKELATLLQAAAPSHGLSAEELNARLTRLTPSIKEAIASAPDQKEALLAPVAAFQADLKAGRLEQAAQELEKLEKLLAAISPTALANALAGWTAARETALGQLKNLETSIRGMNDPEGDAAIILLKAIQANLTARPATAQTVSELERYLTTDEIIDEAEGPNGFGLKVELRAPLLAALGKIRTVLPA